MLKVGILGLGMISGAHIPNYVKTNARAGYCVTSTSRGCVARGRRLGVRHLYTDTANSEQQRDRRGGRVPPHLSARAGFHRRA